MRLRYTFRFQQIGDTWLAEAVGQNAHFFNGVLQLNEVGHFIVSELAELTDSVSAESLELSDSVSAESPELSDSVSAESTELTETDLLNSLTESLAKEYAVDRSTAQSAVRQVLDYLKAEQVLD